tara:strand:- start:1149 stop:1373 length:225 start_codon:yes stop_codon:yes gene_type:complete
MTTIKTYGGKIPKTLMAACVRSGAVTEIGNETESGGGYWVYLSEGYINSFSETGTIHEWTAANCIEQIESVRKL